MRNWLQRTLVQLRGTFKSMLRYLICIFVWQLFLTIFFFCWSNLIILVIIGIVLLLNLFLLV